MFWIRRGGIGMGRDKRSDVAETATLAQDAYPASPVSALSRSAFTISVWPRLLAQLMGQIKYHRPTQTHGWLGVPRAAACDPKRSFIASLSMTQLVAPHFIDRCAPTRYGEGVAQAGPRDRQC